MFFRIKVRALEPKTKREFNPPLEVISAPIKVISKPKQLKKRKTTKRRSLNDMLVETVQRIESQQQAQQECLEELLRNRKRKAERNAKVGGFKSPIAPTTNYIDSINSSALGSLPPHLNNYSNTFNTNQNNNNTTNNNNNNNNINNNNGWDPSAIAEEELAEALVQFFSAYEQLEAEDRPTKIRRVMRSCTTRETEELSELFRDLTYARAAGEREKEKEKEEEKKKSKEGDDQYAYPASVEGCNCLDCPHKLELEKIDEFYKDFLASELPLMEEMEAALDH